MTQSVWRIAVDAPTYAAADLSGQGAKITGGRWNSPGTPLTYCASTIALATLETVVYMGSGSMPFNRFLVRIDIPDAVWAARIVLDPLPVGWDAVPASLTSRKTGEAWVAARSSALLLVPSVIVPDEFCVLINPHQADCSTISATSIRRWMYDPRFFS
jgi:RES domain-containing protein